MKTVSCAKIVTLEIKVNFTPTGNFFLKITLAHNFAVDCQILGETCIVVPQLHVGQS